MGTMGLGGLKMGRVEVHVKGSHTISTVETRGSHTMGAVGVRVLTKWIQWLQWG